MIYVFIFIYLVIIGLAARLGRKRRPITTYNFHFTKEVKASSEKETKQINLPAASDKPSIRKLIVEDKVQEALDQLKIVGAEVDEQKAFLASNSAQIAADAANQKAQASRSMAESQRKMLEHSKKRRF